MRTILLVDDEPEIRITLRRYLFRLGFEVQECSGVSEALSCLKETSYDLILTDYHLPDGNGGAVVEATKRHCPNAICALMSGDVAQIPPEVQAAVALVLEKPLRIEVVEKLISSEIKPRPLPSLHESSEGV